MSLPDLSGLSIGHTLFDNLAKRGGGKDGYNFHEDHIVPPGERDYLGQGFRRYRMRGEIGAPWSLPGAIDIVAGARCAKAAISCFSAICNANEHNTRATCQKSSV